MTFSETQEYDVTARPTGYLEVRRSDVVWRQDVEIARSYVRHVVTPGDDVSNEPQLVRDIATAIWTQEMIDAALAAIESGKLIPDAAQD